MADAGTRWWRYALAGVGVCLVAAAFLPGVYRDPTTGATVLSNPFRFLLTVGPGTGLVALGLQLDRFAIDEDLYGRVVTWCAAGTTVFLTIILLVESMQFYSQGTFSPSGFALHLGASVGALTGAVVGVSETRAVTRAREAARERAAVVAAEEEREKLVFLNNLLRHHVLNGLQIIRGNAEVLTEDHVPESATTIVERSDEITELVQNVRALVDADTSDPAREPVDLCSVLETELAELEADHPEARIQAAVPDGLSVLAGPLLPSVFQNLFRNAVEHNDAASPRVTVAAQRAGDTVRVTIADDGPGIDDVSRAFELGDSGSRGVGLPLSRRLVARYDGELTVDADGDGTTVAIALPAAGADTAARAPTAAD